MWKVIHKGNKISWSSHCWNRKGSSYIRMNKIKRCYSVIGNAGFLPSWHATKSKELLDTKHYKPLDASFWTCEVEEWPKRECQSSRDDEVEGVAVDAKRPSGGKWSEWSLNNHPTLREVQMIYLIRGSCTITPLEENKRINRSLAI